MNEWLQMLLSNAAIATILAVPAAIVSRWGRRPTLAHALWVLVLIKLVTPPLVSVPVWRTTAAVSKLPVAGSVSPGDEPRLFEQPAGSPTPKVALQRSSQRKQTQIPATSPQRRMAGDDTRHQATETHKFFSHDAHVSAAPGITFHAEDQSSSTVAVAAEHGETVKPASAGHPWLGWPYVTALLLTLWLMGTLVYYVRVGWRIFTFRRLIQWAEEPGPKWQEFVAQLAGKIGLIRCPRVVLVPGSVSPMVFAAGRHAILILPKDLVGYLSDDSQLKTLIAHELAHLRRGDHWIRRLELVVAGLYWWLPTVWLTRRGLREVEEEICDAWVVKTLPSANRSYAEALLNTLDFLSGSRPVVRPASSTIGHFRFMKRRLVMIMRGSNSTRLAWSSRFWVLLLAALFLPFSLGSVHTVVADEGEDTVKTKPADESPTFDFVKQRSDDDHDDEDEDRDRRRRRDARDDDDDDDDGFGFDVDEIKAEVLEELKSELAEVNEEIAEAMREVREELSRELKSAPPQLQKIISEVDIDALLAEALEDAPAPIRTFVDEMDIQGIIDEALEDADLDDIEFDGFNSEAMQKMIMKEVSRELKSAMGELNREMAHVQEEVRRAMQSAPPEVRAVLEEIDIESLLEEVLEGSLPVVQEMVEELEIEEIVEEALGRDDDDDEGEDRRERGRDDDDEDEGEDRRDRNRERDANRGDIEERLERRLETLMREAEEIRRELELLRRDRRNRGR